MFISPWLTLSALRQAEGTRSLQPTTFTIRDYFNDIDTALFDAGDPAVVAAQVVADLDSMDTAGAANERLHALLITENADHFKAFNIEAFEELPGSILVRSDVLRALFPLRQVNSDRRLEGAAQRTGAVGEGFIGLDLGQGLDSTCRASPGLFHEHLQIAEFAQIG